MILHTIHILFEKYQKLAKKEGNVIFGGRLGMYQYYDMWQVIDEALKLAEKLKQRELNPL